MGGCGGVCCQTFLCRSLFPVQQTTSGIGHRVKFFFGLANNTLNVIPPDCEMLRRSRCVLIFLRHFTVNPSPYYCCMVRWHYYRILLIHFYLYWFVLSFVFIVYFKPMKQQFHTPPRSRKSLRTCIVKRKCNISCVLDLKPLLYKSRWHYYCILLLTFLIMY